MIEASCVLAETAGDKVRKASTAHRLLPVIGQSYVRRSSRSHIDCEEFGQDMAFHKQCYVALTQLRCIRITSTFSMFVHCLLGTTFEIPQFPYCQSILCVEVGLIFLYMILNPPFPYLPSLELLGSCCGQQRKASLSCAGNSNAIPDEHGIN